MIHYINIDIDFEQKTIKVFISNKWIIINILCNCEIKLKIPFFLQP